MHAIEQMNEGLRAAVRLAEPAQRREAALAFARRWGAEELIVFVRDEAVGRSLPANGFPHALRQCARVPPATALLDVA